MIVLVEVVPDPGPVAQQVLDRDRIVDQGQVGAEQLPGPGVEPEHAVLDQTHHGERGEGLGAAGDADPGADGHRHPVGAVGEPVGPAQQLPVGAVDADHPGERGLGGHLVDGRCQLLPSRHGVTAPSRPARSALPRRNVATTRPGSSMPAYGVFRDSEADSDASTTRRTDGS